MSPRDGDLRVKVEHVDWLDNPLASLLLGAWRYTVQEYKDYDTEDEGFSETGWHYWRIGASGRARDHAAALRGGCDAIARIKAQDQRERERKQVTYYSVEHCRQPGGGPTT